MAKSQTSYEFDLQQNYQFSSIENLHFIRAQTKKVQKKKREPNM